MRATLLACQIAILLIAPTLRSARAEVTAEQVRRAIDRGVAKLKSQQNQIRGHWPNAMVGTDVHGPTALCTLALLNAGVDPKDRSIQRALKYLRSQGEPKRTYATSLQTMVFCAAEPKEDMELIRRNVAWLQRLQIKGGQKKGMWPYASGQGGGDNSNSQFALLALHEAHRVGVPVADSTWRLALAHWRDAQGKFSGGWRYIESFPDTGSMTCAGIASLVIASGQGEHQTDARVVGGRVQCCREQTENEAIERGIQWLGRNFRSDLNPGQSQVWRYYYFYGVERVGRLTGRRFIGTRDWYRRIAEYLVANQDPLTGYWTGNGHAENNRLIATSLALLFLSKGRRPVVIAKLKYDQKGDWNRHRSDAANLTRYVEKRWDRNLTWQVIDSGAATAQDLLSTPVLFISGRDGLKLSAEEKKNLRTYVDQGGFIFAEACCAGDGFDRDFRQLMKELFRDSPLRPLPPEHPAWYAEQKVDPTFLDKEGRWLWGIDACCRTSVIYCPGNLSCYWELSGSGRGQKVPDDIASEIAACNAIGANVLAYATGRELRDKLDVPRILAADAGDLPRGTLRVAQLTHSGSQDDAPAALSNLLAHARRQVEIRATSGRRPLAITDPSLMEYPIAFMHGRRGFRFSTPERSALTTYIERGGFLFANAICANSAFTDSFRREMKVVFPEATLTRIPADDPLLTDEFRGFDLSKVTLRDPEFRTEGDPLTAKRYQIVPLLEAVEIDGRYAVVFSPYDVSCALENGQSLECKGYIREDAAKIGMNVILYALQQ